MDSFKLNDGNKIPKLGFGVFQVDDLNECEKVVSDAIKVGYRLFDTAAIYKNELAVGRAIKKSGIPRSEFFITSKLWISSNYVEAQEGIKKSLKNLDTDYIDLYLIHQPYGDTMGEWRALEDAKRAGKLRSIGVSNFYSDVVKNIELFNDIKPAVNQLEVNPWNQQLDEVKFNQQEDIQVEAWAPFAEGKHDIFQNELLKDIGSKYGKSNGQVILRWLLQRNIVVIPKSTHVSRMKENIDVFDFQLTDEEMNKIAELNKNESQFFDRRDPRDIEKIVRGEKVGAEN